MEIDPLLRGAAASTWLDAVATTDLSLLGTEEGDAALLLALAPMNLNLHNAETAAAVAAAYELMWFLFDRLGVATGEDPLVLVSNFREHVLPHVYPEVHGDAANPAADGP